MKKESKTIGVSPFEAIRKWDREGHEYWLAGSLSQLLGYTRRKDFVAVIDKAIAACLAVGMHAEDHFLTVSPLRKPSAGMRLSRYACYLCIMNADPSMAAVARGQAYMAAYACLVEIQKQEAFQKLKVEEEKRAFLRSELSRHNISLAGRARTAGVVAPEDFAIFQNHGYRGLYGGLDAKAIAARKGLPEGRSLLDHMGSEELSANIFRVTLAEEILREGHVRGISDADKAHFRAGKQVRRAIRQLGGTNPERLPLAGRVAAHGKKTPSGKKEIDPGTDK